MAQMMKKAKRRPDAGKAMRAFLLGSALGLSLLPSDNAPIRRWDDGPACVFKARRQGGFDRIVGDSLAEGMKSAQAITAFPPSGRHLPSDALFVVGEESDRTLERLLSEDVPAGGSVMLISGTNDLLGIGRGIVSDPERVLAHLASNVLEAIEWASSLDIRLVLATVPPCASHRSPRNMYMEVPEASLSAIRAYNRWLLSLRGPGVGVVDLSFLEGPAREGAMDPRYSKDGLHPDDEAYARIGREAASELASLEGQMIK